MGQVYDFNRQLLPSSSNDKTTWTSSDPTIVAPDKNGKVTALRLGTVTITAKNLSGYSDSVTFEVIDRAGTVSNQKELESLLGSGASVITIKTTDKVNLTIPKGDYSTQKLVVIAPNADITNYGKFAAIDIKEIASDTWREEAIGNLLNVWAGKSRIVVGENASVNIEINEAGATLTVVNNGIVEKITISKEAAQTSLDISGKSENNIPVEIKVPNITITTSVPLNLDCQEKFELVLLAGAEETQVQAANKEVIPEIKGTINIDVKVGTGTEQTITKVTATPVATTPTPIPGAGGPSGGSSGGSTPAITTVINGNTTTYTLANSIANLQSIVVNYGQLSYTMDSAIIAKLYGFLSNNTATLENWRTETNMTKTYTSNAISQTVHVTGVVGYSKTVAFTVGPITKTYTVTVDGPNRTVTVLNTAPGSVTYTITANAGLNVLTITKSGATAITPTFTSPIFN